MYIFSHSFSMSSFHFLDNVYWSRKVLNFSEVQLTYFFFCCLWLKKKWFVFYIYGCAGSLLLCAGLLQLQQVGASHSSGFSCCGAQALGSHASVVQLMVLVAPGCWDLPGPGIKPMSPALAGGFFTTEPHGTPLLLVILVLHLSNHCFVPDVDLFHQAYDFF